MSRLVLQTPWTNQPQSPTPIEPQFAQYFTGANGYVWTPNVALTRFADNRFGSVTTSSKRNLKSISNAGIGYYNENSGTDPDVINSPVNLCSYTPDTLTWVFVVKKIAQTDTVGSGNGLWANSVGNNDNRNYSHVSFSAGQATWSVRSSAFGGVGSAVYTLPSIATDVAYVVMQYSYANNAHVCYVNGIEAAVVSYTQSGGVTYNAGNEGLLRGASFNGSPALLLGAVSRISIPKTLLAKISANPWQLFQPLTRNIWVPSAGASGAGVASGNGVATSSIAGASLNQQAASGTGVATGAAVGASTNNQSASGNGVATSSVIGASVASSVAAGDGVATSSIAGASAVGGQGVASGDGVATASIVGASAAESSVTGNGVATVSFISDAPAQTQQPVGVGGKSPARRGRPKKQHVWLVEVDDKEIEVDDLEEVQPIIAKKLAKGKTPVVKAKPLTENPREAATAYTQQAWLTEYVPMPAYDNRRNFVDVTRYLLAMQEMEDEEEYLLMMAAA